MHVEMKGSPPQLQTSVLRVQCEKLRHVPTAFTRLCNPRTQLNSKTSLKCYLKATLGC